MHRHIRNWFLKMGLYVKRCACIQEFVSLNVYFRCTFAELTVKMHFASRKFILTGEWSEITATENPNRLWSLFYLSPLISSDTLQPPQLTARPRVAEAVDYNQPDLQSLPCKARWGKCQGCNGKDSSPFTVCLTTFYQDERADIESLSPFVSCTAL